MNGDSSVPDVLVIGAGQAGLAITRQLRMHGLRVVVLDAGTRVGEAWRQRWDSLTLFTPARHSALPGLPFPGDPDALPTKDAVADYLCAYAAYHELPIRHGVRVRELTRADGLFRADTSAGAMLASAVVVATGPFQVPVIPSVAAAFAPDVVQVHSSGYRNPGQLPAGPVLVVGGGNSGMQIAAELAAHRRVHVSVGEPPRRVPARLLGRDVFSWLDRAGLITARADSRRGRWFRARGGDLVIGAGPRQLERLGVRLHARLTAVSHEVATFADGSTAGAASVVWATGYRPDHSWIRIPGATQGDRVVHDCGVSPVPGLYVIGAPWQRSRGSALLGYVGADAAALAPRVADRLRAADLVAEPAATRA